MANACSNLTPMNLLPLMRDVDITCDKPCYDGRMAKNLLNYPCSLNSSSGFMAERFVKPPVNLVVKFPCSIRVKAIIINNTSGSFTSDSFEILSYSLSNNMEPSKHPVYKRIGRCYNVKPGEIIFINHRYRTVGEICSTDGQSFPLVSHDRTLLNNARHVMIRITHTLNGGLPVISCLQIIGSPHSKEFFKSLTPLPSKTETVNPSLESPPVVSAPRVNYTNEEERVTPADFLDPITCDIMSLPVTLPSGYTIDQSTLDRHVAGEKGWGRNPSDPFTGIPFTESSYPLTNTLLKERIDKYVLMEDIVIGKTTGTLKRKNEESYNSTSRLTSLNPYKVFKHNSEVEIGANVATNATTTTNITTTANSTTTSNTTPTTKAITTINTTNTINTTTTTNTNTITNASITANSTTSANTAPTAADKSDNICSHLTKLLAKSSSFRTVELSIPKRRHCMHCFSTNSEDGFYQLLCCENVICRKCVLIPDVLCKKCMKVVPKSDIVRYHYY